MVRFKFSEVLDGVEGGIDPPIDPAAILYGDPPAVGRFKFGEGLSDVQGGGRPLNCPAAILDSGYAYPGQPRIQDYFI
ncbi:hypothetical protein E2C01_011238 [Portunus trituberculatus]|uniref:Uncharacterized protein n=1 Tax=Portunus trituberculatus TaxID=210409 RepID=A0A5B7DAW5_PORTR|nr:hypothetical protein [Portunus trituberculatus]